MSTKSLQVKNRTYVARQARLYFQSLLELLSSSKHRSLQAKRSLKYVRSSLDLHGMSKDQASHAALERSLILWVDTAMKCDYPWVLTVAIICGGGNQILSDVIVAAWIRIQSRVANRPKRVTLVEQYHSKYYHHYSPILNVCSIISSNPSIFATPTSIVILFTFIDMSGGLGTPLPPAGRYTPLAVE